MGRAVGVVAAVLFGTVAWLALRLIKFMQMSTKLAQMLGFLILASACGDVGGFVSWRDRTRLTRYR